MAKAYIEYDDEPFVQKLSHEPSTYGSEFAQCACCDRIFRLKSSEGWPYWKEVRVWNLIDMWKFNNLREKLYFDR